MSALVVPTRDGRCTCAATPLPAARGQGTGEAQGPEPGGRSHDLAVLRQAWDSVSGATCRGRCHNAAWSSPLGRSLRASSACFGGSCIELDRPLVELGVEPGLRGRSSMGMLPSIVQRELAPWSAANPNSGLDKVASDHRSPTLHVERPWRRHLNVIAGGQHGKTIDRRQMRALFCAFVVTGQDTPMGAHLGLQPTPWSRVTARAVWDPGRR